MLKNQKGADFKALNETNIIYQFIATRLLIQKDSKF